MRKIPKYKYFFAAIDFITINFCFIFAAYIIRRDYDLQIFDFLRITANNLYIFGILSILLIFIFDFNGLYKINIIFTRAAHLTAVIKSILFGSVMIIIVSFMIKETPLIDSRLLVISFALLSVSLLYIFRVEFLRLLYMRLKHKSFMRNVLIIGEGVSGKLLAAKLYFENPIGLNIVGFVLDDKNVNEEIIYGKKVLGNITQLHSITKKYKVDEIIIALDKVSYEHLLEILDICHKLNLNIRLTSELFKIVVQKVDTEKYADVPLIDVSPRYNSLFSFAFKRTFDISASLLALILLSPVLVLIAILIKFSSPGPVLFSQVRIGKDGKSFRFFKFRSMYQLDKEDDSRKKMMLEFMKNGNTLSEDTKIVNGARITLIGKFLRKTSLDELPQFINVIKGDMSLVGPRPCLPYEYENYDNWQKRRLKVLPGCTGVWQISGRSSVSFIDSVILDLYYINNMSPWFDLQIILKTIPVMLFAKGGK